MELPGKRVAVLAEDHYEDTELWYPVLRLREAGAAVTVIGRAKGIVHLSKHNYPVTADAGAAECRAGDFDAVIIPGGYAPDMMRRNPAMIKLVKDAYQSGAVVAAICHAGWMLASADILRGKNATSFFSIKDDMMNAGAVWVDRPVVRDGQLITSRDTGDLPDFMREVVAALSGG